MLLLGAGASVDAGVPASVRMTEELGDRLAAEFQYRDLVPVLRFVQGGLMLREGLEGRDPMAGVNVEDVISALTLLADRHLLEAAPFIATWHPRVDELDTQTADARFASDALWRTIEEGIGSSFRTAHGALTFNPRGRTPPGFSRQLSQAHHALNAGPGRGQLFRSTANTMRRLLAHVVWLADPSRVAYLKPIASLAREVGGLALATLNYDNAIELMAQQSGDAIRTGIGEWSERGEFPTDSALGITLLKLHGSIDWVLEHARTDVQHPLSRKMLRQIDPAEVGRINSEPAVIFGSRSKLTAQGPYLDLLRAFRLCLERSTRLLVVGYSFRDDHVNEYIRQWLNQDASRFLVIVDPTFPAKGSELALELSDRRMNGRVAVIAEPAVGGLQKGIDVYRTGQS